MLLKLLILTLEMNKLLIILKKIVNKDQLSNNNFKIKMKKIINKKK